MKSNNTAKKWICRAAIVTTLVHLTNKAVAYLALVKKLLPDKGGYYYRSKYGKLFYTKNGSGSPLILIHDLQPESSGYEWSLLTEKLAASHTVYTLDLLGCGRSDKPNMVYTSYLYVQILEHFCREVVGEPADIAATGTSSDFVLLAASETPDLAKRILLINPDTFAAQTVQPKRKAELYRRLVALPVFGTCIYNNAVSLMRVHEKFEQQYLYKSCASSEKHVNAYYEAAHIGGSDAKYLYASIAAGTMGLPVAHALPKLEIPVMITVGEEKPGAGDITDAYRRCNPDITSKSVPSSAHLPQLEHPQYLYSLMNAYFDDIRVKTTQA